MAVSKSDRINLRCSPFEKQEWGNAAGGSGKISEWLRNLANQESARLAALPGSGRSGNGFVEENANLDGVKARAVEDATGEAGRSRSPVASSKDQCPRWFHHRSGRYCASCEKVIK